MALATWLSFQSQTGLEDPVHYEAMRVAFPEAGAHDLQGAAAELELHGLATVSKAIGHPLLRNRRS